MMRRPPRSTQGVSSAASDVYKRQLEDFVLSQILEILIEKLKKILRHFAGQLLELAFPHSETVYRAFPLDLMKEERIKGKAKEKVQGYAGFPPADQQEERDAFQGVPEKAPLYSN
eukprot:TRINITY_DN23856_c0_g1_i2.p3 TRINITY_DN23856_c0_g1~~TRINITY_DN23856_c0_g1_i2.p3  ORF type:complete len:115 (+),score=19.18 TRINITY_DN23856_c0_g1_i2:140-484(+)